MRKKFITITADVELTGTILKQLQKQELVELHFPNINKTFILEGTQLYDVAAIDKAENEDHNMFSKNLNEITRNAIMNQQAHFCKTMNKRRRKVKQDDTGEIQTEEIQ